MNAGERIFYLLDEIGMEQKAFAAAIGTTDKTVSTWRTGRTKSYQKYLPQIAEVLNTSVNFILNGTEKEPTTDDGDGLDDKTLERAAKLRALSDDDLELLDAQIDLMLKRHKGR